MKSLMDFLGTFPRPVFDSSGSGGSGGSSGSSGGSSNKKKDKKTSNVTVKSGDTLSAIAAKNNTTVEAIAAANGIKDVNKIQAGASLNIPGAKNTSSGTSSSGSSSSSKSGTGTIGQVSPTGQYAGDGFEWKDSGTSGVLTRTYTGTGAANGLGKDVIVGGTAPVALKNQIAGISSAEGSAFADSKASATDGSLLSLVTTGDMGGSSSYNDMMGVTPVSASLDDLSFGDAFNQERAKQGDGGVFTYKGKEYNTNLAPEVTEPPVATPEELAIPPVTVEPLVPGTTQTLDEIFAPEYQEGPPGASGPQPKFYTNIPDVGKEYQEGPPGASGLDGPGEYSLPKGNPRVGYEGGTDILQSMPDYYTGLDGSGSNYAGGVDDSFYGGQAPGVNVAGGLMIPASANLNTSQPMFSAAAATIPGPGDNTVSNINTNLDTVENPNQRTYDDLSFTEKLMDNYIGVDNNITSPGEKVKTYISDLGVNALAGINEAFGNTIQGVGLYGDEIIEGFGNRYISGSDINPDAKVYDSNLLKNITQPAGQYYIDNYDKIREGEGTFVSPGLSEGREEALDALTPAADTTYKNLLPSALNYIPGLDGFGNTKTVTGEDLFTAKNIPNLVIKGSEDLYDTVADVVTGAKLGKLGYAAVMGLSGSEGGNSANTALQQDISTALSTGQIDIDKIATNQFNGDRGAAERAIRDAATEGSVGSAAVAGLGDAFIAKAIPTKLSAGVSTLPAAVQVAAKAPAAAVSGGLTEGGEKFAENIAFNAATDLNRNINTGVPAQMSEGAVGQGVSGVPSILGNVSVSPSQPNIDPSGVSPVIPNQGMNPADQAMYGGMDTSGIKPGFTPTKNTAAQGPSEIIEGQYSVKADPNPNVYDPGLNPTAGALASSSGVTTAYDETQAGEQPGGIRKDANPDTFTTSLDAMGAAEIIQNEIATKGELSNEVAVNLANATGLTFEDIQSIAQDVVPGASIDPNLMDEFRVNTATEGTRTSFGGSEIEVINNADGTKTLNNKTTGDPYHTATVGADENLSDAIQKFDEITTGNPTGSAIPDPNAIKVDSQGIASLDTGPKILKTGNDGKLYDRGQLFTGSQNGVDYVNGEKVVAANVNTENTNAIAANTNKINTGTDLTVANNVGLDTTTDTTTDLDNTTEVVIDDNTTTDLDTTVDNDTTTEVEVAVPVDNTIEGEFTVNTDPVLLEDTITSDPNQDITVNPNQDITVDPDQLITTDQPPEFPEEEEEIITSDPGGDPGDVVVEIDQPPAPIMETDDDGNTVYSCPEPFVLSYNADGDPMCKMSETTTVNKQRKRNVFGGAGANRYNTGLSATNRKGRKLNKKVSEKTTTTSADPIATYT